MKVAIIGAGVSGLACAHELERYNIKPVIFEDLDFIGDRESHISVLLKIMDRPIKDSLKYFSDICHLDIKPVNIIKQLTHNSANKKVVLNSDNFGYFLKRGKETDSLKVQIHSQIKNTEILFGQKPDCKTLAKEFDFVVVANGSPETTKEFSAWTEWISGWVVGAIVEDTFNPNELIMWINRKYCKNGYAYLTPYDNKKASISLFLPYVTQEEARYYWTQFWAIEKLEYKIIEEFMLEHYSGYTNPHRINNIYFVGNAGGAVSPFLGFGQLNSITMGVFAAKSIVEGIEYEKLIKSILDKDKALYEIRKAFDGLNNNGYDNVIGILGFPGIKSLAYDTNINVTKYSAKVLSLINKQNSKNKS